MKEGARWTPELRVSRQRAQPVQRPTRGTGLTCIRKGKEATVWEEWMRTQVGDEVREVTGGQIM